MTQRLFSSRTFIAILLSILFLSMLGVLGGILSIPRQASREFGPPSITLSPVQRFTYSSRLLLHRNELVQPVDSIGQPVEFLIDIGENVLSVSTRLAEHMLIHDARTFQLYLVYTGMDTSIQAGIYQLSPAMNAIQIAIQLQDATPTQVDFIILPGWRLEEVAAALPTSGLTIEQSVFLQEVFQPPLDLIPLGTPALISLEGFLYPDSYKIDRTISTSQLIATFLDRFDSQVTIEMRDAYDRNGLNLIEAVALASIIQREAVKKDEQALIASVFYNRLAAGMRLESDPTIQYAIGFDIKQNTWWKNPLTLADLSTYSPYNTYINMGIPPGPICNPDRSALLVVAFPDTSPYYYFRARCDGSGYHNFSTSYEEHLSYECP